VLIVAIRTIFWQMWYSFNIIILIFRSMIGKTSEEKNKKLKKESLFSALILRIKLKLIKTQY
jgi:hypothetical protein